MGSVLTYLAEYTVLIFVLDVVLLWLLLSPLSLLAYAQIVYWPHCCWCEYFECFVWPIYTCAVHRLSLSHFWSHTTYCLSCSFLPVLLRVSTRQEHSGSRVLQHFYPLTPSFTFHSCRWEQKAVVVTSNPVIWPMCNCNSSKSKATSNHRLQVLRQ